MPSPNSAWGDTYRISAGHGERAGALSVSDSSPSSHVPAGTERKTSKLKVAGSNPAGVANDFRLLDRFTVTSLSLQIGLGNTWGNGERKTRQDRHPSESQRGGSPDMMSISAATVCDRFA